MLMLIGWKRGRGSRGHGLDLIVERILLEMLKAKASGAELLVASARHAVRHIDSFAIRLLHDDCLIDGCVGFLWLARLTDGGLFFCR